MKFLLGTPCKILHENGCKVFEREHNFKTTTLTSFLKLSKVERIKKIENILLQNLDIFNRQIDYILQQDEHLHMLRVGSDIFPLYTVKEIYEDVYLDKEIKKIFFQYERLSEKVRKSNIRFSMHPGQFTMLVSHNSEVIKNSIQDIEYHNFVFDLIGISPEDDRCEINIHVGKKCNDYVEIFRRSYLMLSENARRRLSIENDEFSYSIYDILELYKKIPIKICFDVHHHFVMHGEYLDPEKEVEVLKTIEESWNGVKPEIHVSQTPENLLYSKKKSDLRQHSDYIYSDDFIRYISKYLQDFDLMIEAKKKNLATKKLLDNMREMDLLK